MLDHVFGMLFLENKDTYKFTEFAIIKLTPPGIIHDFLSVFGRSSTFPPSAQYLLTTAIDTYRKCGASAEGGGWLKIARRARSYAINTNAKAILLMDERSAVYFRFSNTPDNEYDTVEYLVSTTRDNTSPLSMREMVAFVYWMSLMRNGVRMNDPKRGASETVVTTIPDVKRVLDHAPATHGHKRPRGIDADDTVHPKRKKQIGEAGQAPPVGVWSMVPRVTLVISYLQGEDGELIRRDGLPILDPDAHWSSDSPHRIPVRGVRIFRPPQTTSPYPSINSGIRVSLVVEKIITKNVAVLCTTLA